MKINTKAITQQVQQRLTRIVGLPLAGVLFAFACAAPAENNQQEDILTAALLVSHLEENEQQAAALDELSPLGPQMSINNSWRESRCKSGTQEPGYNHKWYSGYFYPGGGSKSGGNKTCVSYFDSYGRTYQIWHNGSTGEALGNPPRFQKGSKADHSRWGAVFHRPAVAHDMCYHHNPRTYGKTQKDCDQYFRRDMYDVCSANYYVSSKYFSPYKKCRRAVDVMYAGVRAFGLAPYNKFNRYAPYLRMSYFQSMAQYQNRK